MTGDGAPVLVEAIEPTESERFWRELEQSAASNMINDYINTAKQIIGMSGVLQGAYFAAISFSSIKNYFAVKDVSGFTASILFVAPMACWAICSWYAIEVLKPNREHIVKEEVLEVKRIWVSQCNHKSENLNKSQKWFLCGFVLLVINLFW